MSTAAPDPAKPSPSVPTSTDWSRLVVTETEETTPPPVSLEKLTKRLSFLNGVNKVLNVLIWLGAPLLWLGLFMVYRFNTIYPPLFILILIWGFVVNIALELFRKVGRKTMHLLSTELYRREMQRGLRDDPLSHSSSMHEEALAEEALQREAREVLSTRFDLIPKDAPNVLRLLNAVVLFLFILLMIATYKSWH